MAALVGVLGVLVVAGGAAAGVPGAAAPRSVAANSDVARGDIPAGDVPLIERALVIHDAAKSVQHLVQDFTFAASDEPRGLLLPIPARPKVSKLPSSPFAKLASKPNEDVAPEPVQLGRVTATVLAPNDGAALAKWLSTNNLEPDAASAASLARYTSRGFYFVALRIQGQGRKDAVELVTETLQITFNSPRPFFPYAEPLDSSGPRLLSVWVLSRDRQVPVALGVSDGQARWLRPWREVSSTRPSADDLKALFSKPVLALQPSGRDAGLIRMKSLELQRFEDQKSSRAGFGDVVMVPANPGAYAPPSSPELRRLMSVLDPEVKP